MASSSSSSSPSALRREVERLSRELDQASAEKVQSAQYGLVLLEEKERLEVRCAELEAAFDNARHELGATQEALAKFETSRLESAQAGIEHEESLLNESAARESSLNTQVLNMEVELKQARSENRRIEAEKEQVERDFDQFLQNKEISAVDFKEVRAELRDFKHRETRLLTDYAELEEENITLQKQISNLRSSQVEFEGSKHEIRHLTEEVDLLNQQVEELANLKKIAEKQLEEALESLQNEREQRYLLKKELDAKMNSDSMYQLGNLALSIQAAAGQDGKEEEDATDVEGEVSLNRENDDGGGGGGVGDNGEGESGPPSDLFTEIHGGELKKMEKKLESAESDRVGLARSLGESQSALEKAREDVQSYQSTVARIGAILAAMDQVSTEHKKNGGAEAGAPASLMDKQLLQLRSVLRESSDPEHLPEGLSKLRSELTQLRRESAAGEQRAADLAHDLRILEKLSSDSLRALGDTHLEMASVQTDLATLYQHVCKTSRQTPSRVMLMRGAEGKMKKKGEEEATTTASAAENLIGKLKSSRGMLKSLERVGDPGAVRGGVETVKDQIRYLRDAVDRYAEELARQDRERRADQAARQEGEEGETAEELRTELQDSRENIVKLKSLLSTKREQIATLRTVLKANKQTAEVALASLKGKYDSEKRVVGDTMTKLRNELRLLKEDAATFSSLRAMFAARCEEYATQVDELQRQVASSEEEKKTLNQLLRMAIQQKLVVTQRLEEVEMASEMRSAPKRYHGGRAERGGGGGGGRGMAGGAAGRGMGGGGGGQTQGRLLPVRQQAVMYYVGRPGQIAYTYYSNIFFSTTTPSEVRA